MPAGRGRDLNRINSGIGPATAVHRRTENTMTNDPAASAATADGSLPPAQSTQPPPEMISPLPAKSRYGIPRNLIIMLGLAGAVIVAAGIYQVPAIIAPFFLAVVLTLTVEPIRGWLIGHGWPRWLASLTLVVIIFAILIGLILGVIYGLAQLVALLPQYEPQMQQYQADVQSWLASLGVTQSDIQSMTDSISSTQIMSVVEGWLTSLTGKLSALLYVLVLVIFLAVDGSVFGARMKRVRAGHEPVLGALGMFARGTRRYFGVATVFGGIVAVLDGIGLALLGVPAAGLWALLAFITNYIPNVGFIIALIPPMLLGLLVGGPTLMIEVLVLYCVINLVIQSVIQPKVVGDTVGLTTTVSFMSLIVWAYLLGPLGAILAVPASLLFKAVLLDVDPAARWLQLFFGDEPVFTKTPKATPKDTPKEL